MVSRNIRTSQSRSCHHAALTLRCGQLSPPRRYLWRECFSLSACCRQSRTFPSPEAVLAPTASCRFSGAYRASDTVSGAESSRICRMRFRVLGALGVQRPLLLTVALVDSSNSSMSAQQRYAVFCLNNSRCAV